FTSSFLSVLPARYEPDNRVRVLEEKGFRAAVIVRTVRELRGEPCLQLEEFATTKQEIICSRSFGERITDYPSMRQA
ncbi:hypothetical protein O5853_32395, partial [Escherichia coli]|nr:hypothetical protein [Escherichia coli]